MKKTKRKRKKRSPHLKGYKGELCQCTHPPWAHQRYETICGTWGYVDLGDCQWNLDGSECECAGYKEV